MYSLPVSSHFNLALGFLSKGKGLFYLSGEPYFWRAVAVRLIVKVVRMWRSVPGTAAPAALPLF